MRPQPTGLPPAPRVRLREVDLLRFLAALAVVLYHYTGTRGGPWDGEKAREVFSPLSKLTQFGYLGVELFFLISGFVILMSVWGRTMAEFTVSRIVRLYPAYWVAVLMIGAIYLLTGEGRGRPDRIIPNLTMFQQGMGVRNVSGVFWTLWAEMHFYALISILVLTGVTYRRCITFMASWTVLAIFADESGSALLRTVLMPEFAPYFIGGMAFFLIHRFGPSLLLWLFAAFSWATSLRHALPTAVEKPYAVAPSDAWPAVAVIVTLCYVVMALVATGRLGWLRWKGLATLGALTYPLYLIHYELGPQFGELLQDRVPYWAGTLMIIAAVLALAYLINRFVEEPLAKWLKPRLRDSFERLQAAEPGRARGRRGRDADGPADDPGAGTPQAHDTRAGAPSGQAVPHHVAEPHGSTPSPPIGSTI
ncbi:acyltransferase family protein [Spirillospora albida]|uniref:acyltransferase family protein n=1 Tax=Spirillospora albida TaxID=58123 RepID=UPI00068BAE59|nr:acyltransferase [Spirillospora albida]